MGVKWFYLLIACYFTDIHYQCFQFVTVSAGLIAYTCAVIINGGGRVSQKLGNLNAIGYAEPY